MASVTKRIQRNVGEEAEARGLQILLYNLPRTHRRAPVSENESPEDRRALRNKDKQMRRIRRSMQRK